MHADRDEAEGEDHADVDDLEARGRVSQALPVADHGMQPQQPGEGDRGADEERGSDRGDHGVSLMSRARSRKAVVRRA